MPPPVSLSYRPDLQGLRAISITLVVLEHAGLPWLPGGFVGVDVFFVLSGYLISGILLREYQASGTIDFLRFAARRLRRLFPALFVMVAAIFAVVHLTLSPHEVREQTGSLTSAITWTSNLHFAFAQFDYFAELRNRDFFLHTWSLGVEEQFYLLWPLVLFGVLRRSRNPASVSTRYLLLTVFALLFLTSFALSQHWMDEQPLWAFYLMPARIWQFSLGASLAIMANSGYRIAWHHAPGALRTLGIAMILGCALWLDRSVAYPGYWALLPSLGGALVISAGSVPPQRSSLLASRPLELIGDISYSWYLWHWPILILGFSMGYRDQAPMIAGLLLLSLLAAALSYRYVEKPVWKGGWGTDAPLRTVLATAAAMLAIVGIPSLHQAEPTSLSIAAQARNDRPAIYERGCDTDAHSAELKPCSEGLSFAPNTVVLVGDSIGVQWYSALHHNFPSPRWRIISLTKSACPMVDQDFIYLGKPNAACQQWRESALEYLSRIHPDLIVVGSGTGYPFTEEQWRRGSERVFARLSKAADRVIVIAASSTLSFDGPGCLERQSNDTSASTTCREDTNRSQASMIARQIALAAQSFPNTRLLDPGDLVCPNHVCSARDPEGHIVFRDSQHLTDTFVQTLTPAISMRLQQLVSDN